MKYLKRFNEGFNLEEIQDFCEGSLVYLIDEGFEVNTETLYDHFKKNSEYICITISKGREKFDWDNVKDYIIPFITILSKNYKLDRKRCILFNGIKYYTYHDPFTQLGMYNRKYGSETFRKTYTPKSIIDEKLKFDKLTYLNSITIFIK